MDSTRPWRAAVLFGCKMLATDPLRPASCVFRLPWLVLVCLVHPTDGWLDGDPGNLEVKSRQILCCASQSIPEPFCHEAGCIILLEQASAIREYRFPERVDMLCKCKSVGLWLVRPGFPPHPHQWALSAHEPFDIGNFSVLGPHLTVATAEQEHPTKATVTQAQSSCHHYLALVTHTLKSSHLSIFSCFQHLSNEDMLFFCAYPETPGVIYFTCQPSYCYTWSASVWHGTFRWGVLTVYRPAGLSAERFSLRPNLKKKCNALKKAIQFTMHGNVYIKLHLNPTLDRLHPPFSKSEPLG